MSSFKDKVLATAVTPENLGKLMIIAMCGAFAVAVWITNSWNEIGNIKETQRQNGLQISTNAATVAAQGIQINQLAIIREQDKELSEERTQVARADRARIQRTLDTILERL